MKIWVSRPVLALGGAAALTTLSLASPALAAGQGHTKPDAGRHAGQGKHAASAPAPAAQTAQPHATGKAHPSHPKAHGQQPHGQGHSQGHGQQQSAPSSHAHQAHAPSSAPAQSHAQSPAPSASQPGSQRGSKPGSEPGSGDPSGNNGTVKIDRLGDVDRIPNNVPHPGCTFQVEWYGFDGGADVVSTVSFTMQAPTRDAGLSVDGPLSVPVGGDAASGAGTASGLDAVQAYTLSFTGAPAKQGYHVRLTVATPRSRGNDTKTKVFWVEPCTSAAAPAPAAATPAAPQPASAGSTPVPGSTSVAGSTPVAGDAPSASGAGSSQDASSSFFAAAADQAAGQAGDQAGPESARQQVSASSAAVPLAVDAGQHGSVLSRWSRSPLGLALILSGLTLAGVGAVLRLRGRA